MYFLAEPMNFVIEFKIMCPPLPPSIKRSQRTYSKMAFLHISDIQTYWPINFTWAYVITMLA